MQIAIITETDEQVEIVAVNGGWTTVRTLGADSREMKVRNGALYKHTTLTGEAYRVYEATMGRAKKAAKAPATKTPAAPRERKSTDERLNGVVYAGYLPQYEAYSQLRDDGSTRRSVDKGDAVALELRVLELADVYQIVSREARVSTRDLIARFEHLNPGMQRMNLGNMLRRVRRQAAKVEA